MSQRDIKQITPYDHKYSTKYIIVQPFFFLNMKKQFINVQVVCD